MKRKEAIKQIQEGKIQVCNDLLPSTKEIKKFLKQAFPKDKMEENNTYILNEFFKKDNIDCKYWFSSKSKIHKDLPAINISTITKRKKAKLSQLEKQFSDLAKDVVELKRERLFTSVSCRNCEVIDAEEIKQETIKEEEIDWSVNQYLKINQTIYIYLGEHDKENCTVYSKILNKYTCNPKGLFEKSKGELTIK